MRACVYVRVRDRERERERVREIEKAVLLRRGSKLLQRETV